MYIEEIKGQVYKKLIDYIFENCTYMVLYTDNRQPKDRFEVHDKIISSLQKNNISINFSKRCLEQSFRLLKNNEGIFNNKYQEWEKAYPKEKKEKMLKRESVIQSAIYEYLYKIETKKWLEKYKDSILFESVNTYKGYNYLAKKYYFKLTPEIKTALLEKKSIYDFVWPYALIDIEFYKNDKLWLAAIGHEKECLINVLNEEEYNLLKAMGIKFYAENFEYYPPEQDEELTSYIESKRQKELN